FSGPTHSAQLLAVATHTPPSVRELNPAVAPALSDLVGRLLAKDPTQRPASAEVVAAELERLGREPGSPSPVASAPAPAPSAAARRPRSRRRFDVKIIIKIVLAPLLLLAGIVITIEWKKDQLTITLTQTAERS